MARGSTTARTWAGRGLRVATAGLAVTAVAALAIDDDTPAGEQVVEVGAPSAPATTPPPALDVPPADLTRLEEALAPIVGGPPTITDSGVVLAEPGDPASSDPATETPAVTTPARVTILSGLLSSSAFGSKVALPLACNAAVGAVGTGFPDPNLSRVLSQIAQSCSENGNQGSDALLALEEDLRALAALNPALDPLVEQFTALLTAAADADAPFDQSIRQLVALVDFFHS